MAIRPRFYTRAIATATLAVAFLGCATLFGCARNAPPASVAPSALSALQRSDLLSWYSGVTTTTVAADTPPTEAARAIWDQHRRDSSLSTNVPTVSRLDGGAVGPASKVLPLLQVASVTEVRGLDASGTSGTVWGHLTHLGRYVVVVSHAGYAAAFVIGHDSSGWRYLPSAPVGTTELAAARTGLVGENALLATTGQGGTVSWWVLGQDAVGHELLVSVPIESGEKPSRRSANDVWKLGPTLFSGSRR